MDRENIKPVSAALTIINIVVFLIGSASPYLEQLMYAGGMMSTAAVLEGHEYYRLITAMFLHAGIRHLVSNMIVLFFIGCEVEKMIGSARFAVLYFASGIVGGLASAAMQCAKGASWNSLGASGAIFGVLGALLVITIQNRSRVSRNEIIRLCFGIGLTMYTGFSTAGIDNYAHVGGFLTGILISLLFRFGKGQRKGTYYGS